MTDYQSSPKASTAGEPDTPDEPGTPGAASSPDEFSASPGPVPLIWRIVAIVVAMAIILVLLLPRLNPQKDDTNSRPSPLETENSVGANSDQVGSEIEAADSPQVLFELGKTYYQTGQWADAIAAYQKAIVLDPTHQSAYVNLGDAYYQQQQLDLAIEAYQQAIKLAPDDADVAYNLGATYLQQAVTSGAPDQAGLEKAISQIELAIELNPELPQPYYALGEAYRLAGDLEQAIQNFETFLALDDGSDAKASAMALQTLEQLKAAQGE